MLTRSWLFVPGDSERKLARAGASGADVLLLDLEDSVAPSRKTAARDIARDFMQTAPPQWVRINALDSGHADADLDAVMPGRPSGILLPKCCGGADVQHLSAKLFVREAQCGIEAGATRILALATETAASLFAMGSFSNASARLVGLTWGAEDLSAALGAQTSRLPDDALAAPYALARALTLLGARAANVAAIDTVFTALADEDGLRAECEAALRDGFDGKLAIHPAQIPVINAAFTPSSAAVATAWRVVEAFAAAPEAGAIALDGRMLDRPHLLRAQHLLTRIP